MCNCNANLLVLKHEMIPWLQERLQTSFVTSLSLNGCPTKGSISYGLSDPVLTLEEKKKFTVRTIVPDTTDGNLNVV